MSRFDSQIERGQEQNKKTQQAKLGHNHLSSPGLQNKFLTFLSQEGIVLGNIPIQANHDACTRKHGASEGVKVSPFGSAFLDPSRILLYFSHSFSLFLPFSPFFEEQQCDGVENPHQLECLGWLDLAASLRAGCQASEPHNTVTYCYLTFYKQPDPTYETKERSTYCWELLPKEMVASQYCICYAHISDYVPNVCCKFQVCRSSTGTSIPIPYTSWQVENRVCVFTPST